MPTLPIRPPRLPHRRGGSAVPWIPEVDRTSSLVDCAVYRDGERCEGHPSWQEALADVRRNRSGFVWLGLHEPSERQLEPMAEAFDLHPLAVEDAVHAHQRPKLERYDDALFAVMKTVHYSGGTGPSDAEVVETGEVMAFVGRDFVITVRHGEHGSLRDLRKRLEADPVQLRLGPSVVLHAILDRVVDSYLTVSSELQTDIDEAESSVFSGSSRFSDANRLYVLKREVLALRRAAAPLAGPLRMLAERPVRFVHDDVREYFRDVDDHLTQVVEQVAGFDDLLTTLVSANLAQVSVVQNEDMRKISAWVAIISVPTMVAGIEGMNFDHMPERHWFLSYPAAGALTLLVCFLLHRSFKRNGWL
ncbi:magnesium and cobalt transport protein CorA [Jatrophihabitans telluris]|uniref:Magnesium and cobalt transport protein CorA n=1 Tax=Jatrophihabitans telluris TaxID=2038343 RepID=A0ABY4R3H0_9ACTN|nr:magnesium and cobalt transport protein CorA [Jatrophihabitans telluris]UQX89701.1 magnesium and cobalt transport protein CorA [Jatrophihabitans telluris]